MLLTFISSPSVVKYKPQRQLLLLQPPQTVRNLVHLRRCGGRGTELIESPEVKIGPFAHTHTTRGRVALWELHTKLVGAWDEPSDSVCNKHHRPGRPTTLKPTGGRQPYYSK